MENALADPRRNTVSTTSDFYLAQAQKCAADAAAATLTQVRDRNLRSEQAWRSMADRLIRTEEARAEKEKRVAMEAAANAAAKAVNDVDEIGVDTGRAQIG
jgi:predicted secreted protein